MKGLVSSLLVSAAFLSAQSFAISPDVSGRQFDNIAPRNIFNLKPETQVQAPPPTAAPLPILKLTGITTMLGYKQAVLKTQALVKPGQPPAEQTFVLAEGQGDGDVEVLQIDEKARRVKVSNSGTVMTLDFEKDGIKQTPSLPVTTPATGSNLPAPAIPTPTGLTPPPRAGVVYPGQRPLPSRYNPNGLTPPPITLPGTTTPVTTNASAAVVPAQPQTNVAPTQMTADEQAVLNELEREVAARTNANAAYAATSPPPRTVIAPQ